MSKTLENKSAMLKDLKKAVNSFVYSPNAAKQKTALDALASLTEFINSIDAPKEQPKPKAKKRKAKSKTSKKAIRRPKRTSEDGLELTQAKGATANKVGKVKKTKVVHAVTEGEALPFEPRKEVEVIEPKARKKKMMKVTLLEGETVEECMARLRSAQIEAARLEAEALIADTAPF